MTPRPRGVMWVGRGRPTLPGRLTLPAASPEKDPGTDQTAERQPTSRFGNSRERDKMTAGTIVRGEIQPAADGVVVDLPGVEAGGEDPAVC